MAHHESGDSIGRVFGLQRTVVREGRMAVWNGLVLQRQVDDVLRAGVRAEAATRESVVELGADAVRDGADRFDDLLGDAAESDDPGPVRGLLERPLDALVTANAGVDRRVVDGLDDGLDRYERALKTVLLAFNRRISALLEKHEALEERLREYVTSLDDDERAERVTEFRRQLSTLQTDLQRMHTRIDGYDPGTAD